MMGQLSKKAGFVLVYILVAIILSALLGIALYTATCLTSEIFIKQYSDKQAYYLACAGIDDGAYYIGSKGTTLEVNASPAVDQFSFTTNFLPELPSGSYGVAVFIKRTGDSDYTVTSCAFVNGYSKFITATFGGPPAYVKSWRDNDDELGPH